ncbi:hypothetical protein G7011_00190 [Pseudomonas plecoglossicida]|uniref:hypothetical protein n=1 Tax=Pseudomonas plecoglossicida TaxID=70775 RepID=UPI0015E335F0|nr:hypothetical protein [Pseudomonas plecoglossicida]MBA1195532.1 hypothetical protein [Pseudomonas plecoglossicida]
MDYPKSTPNVGLVGGKFVDENVTTGTPGSLIPATWGNAVTDELLAVIKAGGIVPAEGDLTQLLKAIQAIAASDIKRSVRVATTGPIALSGLQTIDAVAVKAGERVLVKDQANASQNWIYTVAAGAWVRALDANESAECTPGHLVIVEAGTAHGGSMWQLSNTTLPTLGTTALTFARVFGKTGVAAGDYSKVTVDLQGRVTGGSNPITLAGYGISDAYTKPQVDSQMAGKANNAITLGGYGINDAYTKTEVANLLSGKANSATTLGGYGINDAYTKTEVANLLSSKANSATTLAGYGITDAQAFAQILADFVSNGGWGLGQNSPKLVSDANTAIYPGFYSAGGMTAVNFADAYSPLLVMRRQSGNVIGQLQINARENKLMFRGSVDNGATWTNWDGVWHTGNLVKNTSPTDTTAGSLLRNGDHGTGGQAVSTEVDLSKYRTGGKYVTPNAGLVGLPPGWAQGRHVIDVSGGDGYCVQRLTGPSVNKGRSAYRVWDGAWADWDEVLTAKGHAEATLADLLAKVSSTTYVSPRGLADISFGMGQTPQNMTSARAWATNYTNTTNKTIVVSINVRDPANGNLSASLSVAGELWANAYMSGGSQTTLTVHVPPGATYRLDREDTNDQILKWMEYR